MSITQLLARVVARQPDDVAVEEPARDLSFIALDERSNAIAQRLRALGVGSEKLVGICTRPSIDIVVAMLAVLKAGGAFVLLDLAYPARRLAAMLEDSALSLVLVDAACRGTPALAGIEQVRVDGEPAPADPLDTRVAADHLAYVVFTSGSTGRPKGVAVTHRGLVNLIERQIETFRIDTESRVLQFAALGFDAVISEVFTALAAGATLCIEDRAPGRDVGELLARRAISVVTLPPSLLRILSPDGMPGLRTIVSAGEACSAEIVARWARGRRMVNAYGPSECTVCATMKTMAGPDDSPTIGRAIAGVTAYVLDDALMPVGADASGELYLAGPALARGYLGQHSLTAERFVPDPFAGSGARMYRTGDVVRRTTADELEYLGRSDDQVKIRGFRVEPGEVEAVLRELDGIDDVVVQARARASGDVTLVAYVLSRDARVREHEIVDFARESLPPFLRPAEAVVVTAWPMSPNGKIDRKALATLRPHRERPLVPPRTATERGLDAVARDVLDRPEVDLDRTFFEEGGDSIAAVRLVLAIGRAFGCKLPVGTLFASATLRDVATRIDAALAAPAVVARRAVVPLRAGSAVPPIWLQAPVHGNALCYLRFASLLGRDLQVVGLQMPGLDGEAEPIADFVALAAHQIRTIREHQPHGPYVLAGWSLGGSLAFEMAVQLQQAGETVSRLVLMAATPPSPDHLEAGRATMKGYEIWRMAYFYLRTLAFSLGASLRLDLGELSGLTDDLAVERVLTELRKLGPFGGDVDFEIAKRWLGIVRANLYAFHHHVSSGQFAGRTLIVHASAPNPISKDTLVRERSVPWGSWDHHLVGTVDVHDVGANHFTLMLEPWVGQTAAIFERWLRAGGIATS